MRRAALLGIATALWLATATGPGAAGAAVHSGGVMPADACGWHRTPVPPVAGQGQLFGVLVRSALDGWAVGGHGQPGGDWPHVLVEHWNGTAWSKAGAPDGGAVVNQLHAVDGAGPDDVWAVGFAGNESFVEAPLIEHWDGVSWTVIPGAHVSATDAPLESVSVVSANDVWAVGRFTGHDSPMIQHWDGLRWSLIDSPTVDSGELASVDAVSSNDVWAVGTQFVFLAGLKPLIERWDGTAWTLVDASGLNGMLPFGISARASGDVWTVGSSGPGVVPPATAHWDGYGWTEVPTPSPGYAGTLVAVDAFAADDTWTVGGASRRGTGVELAERWNGTQWRVGPVAPRARHVILRSVSGLPGDLMLAVGDTLVQDRIHPLAQRFVPCPA